MTDDATLDLGRRERIGLDEAILCQGKTVDQIAAIVETALETLPALLLTRLDGDAFAALPRELRDSLDYDPVSRTAIAGTPPEVAGAARVAVVTAGTSDLTAAREAVRTLTFYGVASHSITDVGAAGLWRLLDRLDELRRCPVTIVAAGMDGALFSVVGGLVGGPVIALPVSTGYGAARHGETALFSALASCAPGVAVVNIDNGYGAASAALRILSLSEPDETAT